MTAALAILRAILSGLWSVLMTRAGQIALAFLVAWFWSGHRTANHWRDQIAAEKAAAQAAYEREVARQEEAAREIAAAATARVEDEMKMAAGLRDQVAELEREEAKNEKALPSCTPAVVRPCRVDDAFADRMRRLDAAAGRKAAPSRAAR